jgi:DNA-binding LacI/PurR family transcriptional regulator
MRVTIRDVANRAVVSQTTVSLVLNDAPGVSVATRDRVRRIIAELNYSPSALARSFSSSRAETIAFVMPPWSEALEDPYFVRILRGVLEGVRDRGYKMLVEVADERFIEQRLWRDLFDRKRVDGLMIAMPLLDADYLTELAAHGPPVLLINGVRHDLPSLHSVGSDDRRCGFDATYYLLGLGHRRIAHFGGPLNQSSSSDRLAGYREAFDRAHVSYRDDDVFHGAYDEESGAAMLGCLLQRPSTEMPTAVFCANDNIAVGVLRAAGSAGVSVPGQLSLIGVDDSAAGRRATPPLTTMRQDLQALGSVAADHFICMLDSRVETDRLRLSLPMELVERESCSRPSQGRRR